MEWVMATGIFLGAVFMIGKCLVCLALVYLALEIASWVKRQE